VPTPLEVQAAKHQVDQVWVAPHRGSVGMQGPQAQKDLEDCGGCCYNKQKEVVIQMTTTDCHAPLDKEERRRTFSVHSSNSKAFKFKAL
jgi:hypothetical protein